MTTFLQRLLGGVLGLALLVAVGARVPASAQDVTRGGGSGGGTGTPGGSNTQVQFNDGGAFGGDAGLTYDKTFNTLEILNGYLSIDSAVSASTFFVLVEAELTPTVDGTTRLYGVEADVEVPNASTHTHAELVGYNADVQNHGSGNYTQGLWGARLYAQNQGAGSTTGAVIGTEVAAENTGSGSATTLIGFLANVRGSGGGGGTTTTAYGLKLSVVSGLTMYGLYVDGDTTMQNFIRGNTLFPASTYLNWGVTYGTGGYGFRDNAGTMEFKNSAGSWAAIATAAGSAGGWTDSGTAVHLTTGTDTVSIGIAATEQHALFQVNEAGALALSVGAETYTPRVNIVMATDANYAFGMTNTTFTQNPANGFVCLQDDNGDGHCDTAGVASTMLLKADGTGLHTNEGLSTDGDLTVAGVASIGGQVTLDGGATVFGISSYGGGELNLYDPATSQMFYSGGVWGFTAQAGAPSRTSVTINPTGATGNSRIALGPDPYLSGRELSAWYWEHNNTVSAAGTTAINLFRDTHTSTDLTAVDGEINMLVSCGFGYGAVAAVGTQQCLDVILVVEGSGNANNQTINGIQTHRIDIGTGYTQAAGPTTLAEVLELNLFTSINVQMSRANVFNLIYNNYYNGSPLVHPGAAIVIETDTGAVDGNDATHTAATTYAVDVGMVIAGKSTGGNTGFTTGIRIGGEGSVWAASSKIGTGLVVQDYTTRAIYVNTPSGTPTADVETPTVTLTPTVVGSLPTCNAGNTGRLAYVTDASVPVIGNTVASGAAAKAGVACNGANWTVFAK